MGGMMKKLLAVMALLPGCMTASEMRNNGRVHTISFYTGRFGQQWYDSSFEREAVKICGGKDYKVLEKSAQPSTLADTPGVLDSDRFFWVIECLSNTGAHA